MKVIINPDGRTCTTVNPLGDKPDRRKMGGLKYISKMIKWEKAESERQTFEIVSPVQKADTVLDTIKNICESKLFFEPGTTHEAEIVNGKAVIK